MMTMENTTYRFEQVERFKYLGTVFTCKPCIKEEISNRIMRANRCVEALDKLLRNKNISRGAKLKTYKTVIRSILTYASEIWVRTKMEQDMILVWEGKVLRRIFGGKVKNGQWEKRTNKELEVLYGEPNVI